MTLLFALANHGESRLILAGVSRWGLWLAAGIAALMLILILFRYERKLVSKRAGLTLLSLRVLAVLALIAALFEPITARTYRETVRGRVVLGVDLSESMATADSRDKFPARPCRRASPVAWPLRPQSGRRTWSHRVLSPARF